MVSGSERTGDVSGSEAFKAAEKLVAQGDKADPAEVARTLAEVIREDPQAFRDAMKSK